MGDSFNKNVLILLSGTVIAQAITILCSPLLTRLYSPSDFGGFALMFSLGSVLMPLSMGRYEQAIVVAKDGIEARTIAKGAFLVLCAMSVLTALVMALLEQFGYMEYKVLAFALPLFIFLSGLLTIVTQYVLKQGKFNHLNGIRITQSAATVICQIAFTFLGLAINGLIVGTLAGLTTAFLYGLSRQVRPESPVSLSKQFEKVKVVLSANRDFPIKNSFPALLDALSVHMPVFFLSHYYAASIVGQYALAVRIVSMPITFIGTSVGQVFFQSISNQNEQTIKVQFTATFWKLFALAILPVVVLLPLGPILFSFVFGEEWKSSGLIAAILIIPYGMRMIVSPLSSVLIVKRRFKAISTWQFSYFIGTAAVLFYFSHLSIENLCIAYAMSEVLFYTVYFLLIRRELYK